MKEQFKRLIYQIIDLAFLNHGVPKKINGFSVKFPASWSRYFEKDYEKENVLFLKENCQVGMTAIDVGAHLGLISVILSKLVGETGKVFAFEPTPITFELLNKIIVLNKAESIIKSVNKAVGKEKSMLNFYLSEEDGSNSNSLVAKSHKLRQAILIESIGLDDFVVEKKLQQLDIIKIDAEGTEYDVLFGAEQTLLKFKPKIILALHPSLIINNKQSLTAIFGLIKKYNYSVIYKSKIMSESEFCNQKDFFDVHLLPNQ